MKIKIVGKTEEDLKSLIERIMNLAHVAVNAGRIPDKADMEHPEQSGMYWYEENRRYHLLPIGNNHWANVRERGDSFIVVEFNYRYDKNRELMNTLSRLILCIFESHTIEVD